MGKKRNLKLNVKFTLAMLAILAVPFLFFSAILFYTLEEKLADEAAQDMAYCLERNWQIAQDGIRAVNLTAQFFQDDTSLAQFLAEVKAGEDMDIASLRDFYLEDVAFLEKMVNSNTYLYQVRVYAESDQMQEMMPLLFKHSRMERMSWSGSQEGWQFDYQDELFDTLQEDRPLVSKVIELNDFEKGKIGTLEVSLYMETLFPALYGEEAEKIGYFVTDGGALYTGSKGTDYWEAAMEAAGEETDEEVIRFKYSSSRFIVGKRRIPELSGTLVILQQMEEDYAEIRRERNRFLLLILGLLGLLGAVVNVMVKQLLKRFYEILKSIREIRGGNLKLRLQGNGTDEMGELGTQINQMLDRIEALMKEKLDRELLAKNSEIRALQNQINAHFIYNVLESIKMMAELEEEYGISDAVTSLGKLLRYSMKWTSGTVSLRMEVDYIRDYLALMNLRFDYEIYLSLNIPEALYEQEIPKMSLQPIVENAIYHGIEELAEDTNIYIKGIMGDGEFRLEVSDAGKGMTSEELERVRRKLAGAVEASGGTGNGIGLKNVQDRIRMNFGEEYGLEIYSEQGCFTKVIMRLPVTLRKDPQHAAGATCPVGRRGG